MFAPEKLLHMTHVAADQSARHALESFYLDVFGAQTYLRGASGRGPGSGRNVDPDRRTVPDSAVLDQPELRAGQAARILRRPLCPDGDKNIRIRSPPTRIFASTASIPSACIRSTRKIFFMTDPKETLDIRYELCAVDMPNDLRLRPGWSANWWRDSHPLGIEKLASIATATDDLGKATRFYKEAFGLQDLGRREVPEESAKAAAFRIGSKSPFVIEVMGTGGQGHAAGRVRCEIWRRNLFGQLQGQIAGRGVRLSEVQEAAAGRRFQTSYYN